MIQQDVSLAPLTTFGVGGPAQFFVRATNEHDVVETVKFASENALPLFILGGGSNILVSDSGFNGIVLQIAIAGIQANTREGGVFVEAGAGEDWDGFVQYCVENDLAGVECLSGIPGFVGGTPVQNVGAYGQDVAETIRRVKCLDRESGQIVVLDNSECEFAYRESIFNTQYRDRFIVLSVTFELLKGGSPKIVYRELADHFSSQKPSIQEVRDAVLKIRRSKSMVLDPLDPNSKSAGSFFRNPIVSKEKLEKLRTLEHLIPSFEYGEMFKIPAAWLIEKAGFHKGFTLGRAGISSNHSLAIVNCGNSTAAEIVALKDLIQKAVATKFGIELQPEPIFVGF